jgi:ATP-binding cassette, subfamily C, bacterial
VSALFGAMAVLLGVGVVDIAPPVLVTLLLVLTRMSGPAGQIQQAAAQLAYDLPAYEKLRELEKELAVTPREATLEDRAPKLPDGPIVFENVSFHHARVDNGSAESSAEHGVRDLDLTIAAGEFIGVTGSSGAGKSTFCDLLLGLIPPQTGRICVGNAQLDGALLLTWRTQVSYVAQDPFLFHDTIRRNLAWVNPEAAEEDHWVALAVAGAEVLAGRMKRGLDTVVGERGTLISGGERQRIALARAVLRNRVSWFSTKRPVRST